MIQIYEFVNQSARLIRGDGEWPYNRMLFLRRDLSAADNRDVQALAKENLKSKSEPQSVLIKTFDRKSLSF